MERFTSLFRETEETQRRRQIKINSIPKRFSEPTTACIVCLEDIQKLQVVQLQPCYHMVHRGCLAAWARTTELNLIQEVKCPACNSNITHIVYISDNNDEDETLTLADYMRDYNRLTNTQLTVKFLSEVWALTREGAMIIASPGHAAMHVARALARYGIRDERVRPLVQEHIMTLLYAALAVQVVNALSNIGTNQTGAKYNKSRKHNKSNKSRKFRKSRKNLKIQKK